MATDRTLFTAAEGSDQLRIELLAQGGDLPIRLDCNRRQNGSPAWLELPRRYSSVRGAKQAAARLLGAGVKWVEAPPATAPVDHP